MRFGFLPEGLLAYEKPFVIINIVFLVVLGPILVCFEKVRVSELALNIFALTCWYLIRREVLFSHDKSLKRKNKWGTGKSVPILFLFSLLAIVVLSLFVSVSVLVSSKTIIETSKEKLSSDLSISNQVEYLASSSHGESIVIYRLLTTDFPFEKFTRVYSDRQKFELARNVSESAAACNLDFSSSAEDDFYVFYGNDCFVVCTKSNANSYLIVRGAW